MGDKVVKARVAWLLICLVIFLFMLVSIEGFLSMSPLAFLVMLPVMAVMAIVFIVGAGASFICLSKAAKRAENDEGDAVFEEEDDDSADKPPVDWNRY